MTIFHAFAGGIGAFFSVWIFCLMQIIPFFLAFIVGAALTAGAGVWRQALVMPAVAFGGFILIFTSMGMTTTALSRAVFSMAGLGTQIGGVITGLAGFYFLGLLAFGGLSGRLLAAVRYGFAFLFGAAMGFAYKPCVTPTLTKIFTLTSSAQTASAGGAMLVFYALGISAAILAAGMALVWAVTRTASAQGRSIAAKVCGAVLITAALLMLTDGMAAYKRFLVGRFVPDAAMTGGGDMGEHHHH